MGLLLYIPFAGTYGLWDPWETHYSEVARQMTARGDYISLWWPGAPIDADHFWSKPVLSFWIMSLAMHLVGIRGHGQDAPGEMALGSKAEWAVRVPFCLMGVLGIYAVYLCVSRFVSRRAGVFAALVAATVADVQPGLAPGDDRHGVRRADDHGAGAGRAGAVRRRGRAAAAARAGSGCRWPDHRSSTRRSRSSRSRRCRS